jgi:hypothetical protein
VTQNMGAPFVLYAQGLLPFVIPLSVLLFEPDMKSLGACRYFWRSEGNYAVYALGVDRSLNYAAAIWG